MAVGVAGIQGGVPGISHGVPGVQHNMGGTGNQPGPNLHGVMSNEEERKVYHLNRYLVLHCIFHKILCHYNYGQEIVFHLFTFCLGCERILSFIGKV